MVMWGRPSQHTFQRLAAAQPASRQKKNLQLPLRQQPAACWQLPQQPAAAIQPSGQQLRCAGCVQLGSPTG